jgi:hypothetical protein
MKRKMIEPEGEPMLPEYDFSEKKGVRGKHAKAMREGYTVTVHREDGTTLVQNFALQENAVVLDPDVRVYFRDSESVNRALRSLISLFPEQNRQVRDSKEKYGK